MPIHWWLNGEAFLLHQKQQILIYSTNGAVLAKSVCGCMGIHRRKRKSFALTTNPVEGISNENLKC